MKCDKCNGTGLFKTYQDFKDIDTGITWLTTRMCLKCYGVGELDWIENIVGKDHSDLQKIVQGHPTTKWSV